MSKKYKNQSSKPSFNEIKMQWTLYDASVLFFLSSQRLCGHVKTLIITVDEAVSCEWFFEERRRWLIKELSSSGLSTHTDYKANLFIDYRSRIN